MKILIVCLVAGLTAMSIQACGDDDTSSGGGDPTAACDSMCKGAGFSSSKASVEPHETNCFCTGAGTVTAEACTTMCKSTGKPGTVFGSGAGQTANACQCQ